MPISSAAAIIRLAVTASTLSCCVKRTTHRTAGIPDHSLAGSQADQRQNHDLEVLPLTERLGPVRGALDLCPRPSSSGRLGDSGQRHANPDRDGQQQQNGNQEGNTPAPVGKLLFAHRRYAHPESPAATGTGPALPWSESTRCKHRACHAAHVLPHRWQRRCTHRPGPDLAACAARSG